jgi:hypothetical protein
MYKSLDKVYIERVIGFINEEKDLIPPVVTNASKKIKKPKPPQINYDEIITGGVHDENKLNSITPIAIGSKQIHKNDLPIWKELYFLSPPKIGESEGASKGSGNGELAIYWFLKKNPTYTSIKDARYSITGSADMMIGDTGIEVKAYPLRDRDIKIGRYKQAGGKETGYKNNVVLNTVLGLNVLLSKISLSESDIKTAKKEGLTTDAANFKYDALNTSFQKIGKLYKIIKEEPALQQFSVFQYLRNNIETVYNYNGIPYSDDSVKFAEDNAKQLLWNYARTKLIDKPGANGYIVNCNEDGNMEWMYVSKNLLNNVFYPNWFTGYEVHAAGAELFINKNFFKHV